MPAFIGKKLSVFNAISFARDIQEEAVYLYVGRSTAWDDEDSPPSANDSVSGHAKIWDNMSGAIRVLSDQVSLAIKRNDWSSGNVYDRYDHANTAPDNFYVLAGSMDRDVYKCLDNNGRAPSNVKPTHQNLAAVKGQDGYMWKYMYSIPESHFKQFATSSHLPVFRHPDVSKFGSRGSILNLPITANSTEGIGSYYRSTNYSNGTLFVSAVNASIYTTVPITTSTNEITVIADSGLAIVDDYYVNSAFYITSGGAKGTYRLIVDSKANGYALTDDNRSNLVLSSVVSNFSNGDNFIIGPRIRIDDIDGYGFLGIAITNSHGNITSIAVSSIGSEYTDPDASVHVGGDYHPTTNNFVDGTGATVSINISPPVHHGFDPITELNAKYVIISPETSIAKDHQTGTFVGYGNEIRQVGLLKNPVDAYSNRIADAFSYDLKTTVYFGSMSNIKFKKDQVVYNHQTAGEETASGIVWNVCGSYQYQYITLTNVRGQLWSDDVLYNRLGDSATISSSELARHRYPISSLSNKPPRSVVAGGLTKYTGDILYHENISPITRRLDQKENFKFIFEF